MLDYIAKKNKSLAKLFVWISGCLLILSSLIVTFDVLMRKIFNVSLSGADEISGYIFGITTMLSLSYALIDKTNIRVDAIYAFFPEKLKVLCDLLGLLLLTAFIAIVTYYAYLLFLDTVEYWSHSITPLRTPLAIPQFFWLFGLVFTLITGIIMVLRLLEKIIKNDMRGADQIFGILSTDEEIDEATRGSDLNQLKSNSNGDKSC